MDVQVWGYANHGDRRHILQPSEPSKPGLCCGPQQVHSGVCCFLGNAVCGAFLVGQISDKNLRYWVPCRRCLKGGGDKA